MKGYRADTYSQIERLAFMAFFEREHAVFCRNLEAQIASRTLKALVGRIASDEERHEEFFANLVSHLLTTSRDETIAAIARRAAELDVVGGDIDAYADKVQNDGGRRHLRAPISCARSSPTASPRGVWPTSLSSKQFTQR